jgi:hypothetical protein
LLKINVDDASSNVQGATVNVDQLALADYFRFFAEETRASPLYVAMCPLLADNDLALTITMQAAPTQRRPNLLLAAMHASLLRDPSADLALWHRTCGGDRDPTDPRLAAAINDLLVDRTEEITASVISGATQTNEPGRSAILLAALGHIAEQHSQPLGLLDVGTSAGLNLRLDEYSYTYSGTKRNITAGNPRSPVHIQSDISRSTKPLPVLGMQSVQIAHRAGVDLNPLDVSDPDQRRWLRALIWPDEQARFDRLTAALDVAAAHPIPLQKGDATASLQALIDAVPQGVRPVITTTWVLTYLTENDRIAFVETLAAIGKNRPLSWVFIEHPSYASTLPSVSAPTGLASEGNPLMIVDYAGDGTNDHTIVCAGFTHPHGTWINWQI